MVIVNVVNIDRESVASLRNTGIPCTVVYSRVKVVHSRWIRLRFGLLPEDGRVKQDVCDVVQCVVLDSNRIRNAENCNSHWIRGPVDGVVYATDTRDNPNKILIGETLAHELGHDAQTTNLDLDSPIFDVLY